MCAEGEETAEAVGAAAAAEDALFYKPNKILNFYVAAAEVSA